MSEPTIPPAALADHLDFARRLARSLIEDADVREDVVQDAWLAALSEPPQDPERMRGWLATVVRRLSLRRRRTDARRIERERAAARAESLPGCADQVAAMEVHRRVVDALMELPGLYRRALLLRYFDDLTIAAIAARCDEPVETVRTRLRRGLEKIRAQLSASSDGEPWVPALAVLVRTPPARTPPARPSWVRRIVTTAAAASLLLALGFAIFLKHGGREALLAYYDRQEPGLPYGESSAPIPVAMFGPGTQGVEVDRRERLGAALGLPLEEVEELAPPMRAQRALVQVATEASGETIESVELFLAQSNGASVHLALVPIEPLSDSESDSSEYALLAMSTAHEILAVVVVDTDLERARSWDHFLGVFRYATAPRLEGARPRSWLAERRRRAIAAPDESESPIVIALMDLQRFMNEQASAFNLPKEGRALSLPEELEMMAQQYRNVAELAPQLRPLFGDSVDELATLALDSAAGSAAMKTAFEAGDMAEMASLRKRVMGNCRDCHFMPGDSYEGRLADASAEARAKLGIGSGFFELGYDLRIGHHDRDAAQRVADAARLGALMIDAN